MESLYYLTLSYLRKNQHLITDNLNYTVSHDITEIIKNKNYLSSFLRCRKVYNWNAIYSYIAKHHVNTKYVASCLTEKYKLTDLTKLPKYIKGYYITQDGHIYQPSNKTIHYIVNLHCYKFEHRLTPKTDFINIFMSTDKDEIIISEEFFKGFPNLLDWLERNDNISKKLIVKKDLLYPV